MHICYIHQHFCTNEGSSGTRSYDVSRHLAAMGHKVTMICGVGFKSGLKKAPWYKPISRISMAGFDVIVCNVSYSNNQGMLARIWSFVGFAMLASIAAVFMVRRPNVVFATSLPLTVCIPGYLGARTHRVPFVFEVRDICPEGDVLCGSLREGSAMERALSVLEWFSHAKCDKLLLVSPGFQKRLLERGFDGRKMRTILLGADGDIFKGLKPDKNFRKTHGLQGKTVALYAGVHGTANGLDYILHAAEHLNERDDIAFVLLGDGREKPHLVERAKDMGLENIVFADYVPKTELPGILAACDIGLMILRDIGQPRPVTPNKIFDYMFASMASVVNFRGPTIEMVEADGTGVFADPHHPEQLAERVAYWADNPKEAKQVGKDAREIAYKKYDRSRIAEQREEVFLELTEKRTAAIAGEK